MDCVNLWRFFGSLPPPPDDFLIRPPADVFSRLQSACADRSNTADRLPALAAFALQSSRVHFLDVDGADDAWTKTPLHFLYRARILFFRALADNPESPDIHRLNAAADDFRRAAEERETAIEALTGLMRIHTLLDDTAPLRQYGNRMRRIGGLQAHKALAGLSLFFASLPNITPAMKQRRLRSASATFARLGGKEEFDLMRARIDMLLGRPRAVVRRLNALAGSQSLEAMHLLLRWKADRARKTACSKLREEVLAGLDSYQEKRPHDPRGLVIRGDVLLDSDEDSAHRAWQNALLLDDCCADAWERLGHLHMAAREKDDKALRLTRLEAAADAYRSALLCNPLESRHWFFLGRVNQFSGHAERAIGKYVHALALDSDQIDARRGLAESWLEMARSEEYLSALQAALAGQARREWKHIVDSPHGESADLVSYLQASALDGAPNIPYESLLTTLLTDESYHDADGLIDLAEDFIHTDRIDEARRLLDVIILKSSDHPRVMALYALVTDDAEAAGRLLEKAAAAVRSDSNEFAEWTSNAFQAFVAAGMAQHARSVVRSALMKRPACPLLARILAENLADERYDDQALEILLSTLSKRPDDMVFFESILLFLRERDWEGHTEHLLRSALENNPDEPRLWNHLGVHLVEASWSAEDGALKLQEAVDCYHRALNSDSGNAAFQGNLGDALRQLKRWDEAAHWLKAAAGASEDSAQTAFATNSLARLEDDVSYLGSTENADSWEAAGVHYRVALENDAHNVDYLQDYAWWLYRERRLDEAAVRYSQAAKLRTDDEKLPYWESVCWRELGDNARALSALDRALSIKKDDKTMLVERAEILGDSGSVLQAEEIFAAVLDRDDRDPWVWEKLALFREKRALEADPLEETPLLDLNGQKAPPQAFTRGRGWSFHGDIWYKAALGAWTKVLGISPEKWRAKIRIALVLMKLGDFRKSYNQLTALLSSDKRVENAVVLNALGRLELINFLSSHSSSLRHLAESRLTAAVNLEPENAQYNADLAYWHSVNEDWNLAFEAFTRAVDEAPDSPRYAASAGIAAYRANRFDEAAAYLTRALSLSGTSGEWLNNLGLAFMAQGRQPEALESFQAACLANPINGDYTANLTMAHESFRPPSGPVQ